MKKFKRLMALMALGMLSIQLLGVGTAFAGDGGTSECDAGSDDLEITIGSDDPVQLWLENGTVYCDTANGGGYNDSSPEDQIALKDLDSITVEMDNEYSDEDLSIGLGDSNGDDGAPAEWAEFDTFDIDVSSTLYLDGSGLDSGFRNSTKIVVGSKSVSFGGTTATFAAYSLDIKTGDGADLVDASKATVALDVNTANGNDVIKGGSKNDDLSGAGGLDVIYGNGGNDDITCDSSSTKGDAGWGGAGLDDIGGCYTAAPGADDDSVDSAVVVLSYADLKDGIEWAFTNAAGETAPTVGGAAGNDDIDDSSLKVLYGSQGDDVIVHADGLTTVYGLAGDDAVKVGGYEKTSVDYGTAVLGGAGDDMIAALDFDGAFAAIDGTDNAFYGNAGNDVLRGKGGEDTLSGGPGADQAWGGGGKDTCGAEVTNRCEFVKKSSL